VPVIKNLICAARRQLVEREVVQRFRGHVSKDRARHTEFHARVHVRVHLDQHAAELRWVRDENILQAEKQAVVRAHEIPIVPFDKAYTERFAAVSAQ